MLLISYPFVDQVYNFICANCPKAMVEGEDGEGVELDLEVLDYKTFKVLVSLQKEKKSLHQHKKRKVGPGRPRVDGSGQQVARPRGRPPNQRPRVCPFGAGAFWSQHGF